MSSYDGRLHMPGRSRIPLGVEVDITGERMTLTTGDRELGDWSLKEVEIMSMPDGFHITLDDEEVILSIAESDRFVSELGPVVRRPPRVIRTSPVKPYNSGNRTERVPVAPDDKRFEAIAGRIAEIADALANEEVAPAEAFGKWLGLLKEINLLHGEGAMPKPLFYRFNTRLLELIPEPE